MVAGAAILGPMAEVKWDQRPQLRRPILLLAFEGWFDAGECATSSVKWLTQHHEGEAIADIDPEEFFDFQENRPEVRFEADGSRVILWPENRIYAAPSGTDHDLILLAGVEPRLKWRTFTDSVLEVVEETSAELVVTLGAMVGSVPHTRPPVVKGSATNPELVDRLRLDRPSYQGPTGIMGALHDTLDRNGVPVLSLRVSVPHYVSGPSNPKGQQALLRRLEQVIGIDAASGDLDAAVLEWEERVSGAVGADEEVLDYVQRLEEEADRDASSNLPSGDDLAQEFQRFLRRNGDDHSSDDHADDDDPVDED